MNFSYLLKASIYKCFNRYEFFIPIKYKIKTLQIVNINKNICYIHASYGYYMHVKIKRKRENYVESKKNFKRLKAQFKRY